MLLGKPEVREQCGERTSGCVSCRAYHSLPLLYNLLRRSSHTSSPVRSARFALNNHALLFKSVFGTERKGEIGSERAQVVL